MNRLARGVLVAALHLAVAFTGRQAAAATAAPAQVIDRVAIVVGHRMLLWSDYRGAVARESKSAYPRAAAAVLESLVDSLVYEEAASELSVRIDDAQVDAAMAEVAARAQLTVPKLLEAAQQQGFTEQAYREELRRQLTRMRCDHAIAGQKVAELENDRWADITGQRVVPADSDTARWSSEWLTTFKARTFIDVRVRLSGHEAAATPLPSGATCVGFGQLPTTRFDDAPLSVSAVVREVSVETPGAPESVTSPTVLATRVGKPWSTESIASDLRALYSDERHLDARATVEPMKDGVRVVYWLQERPLLREVVVEGATTFDTSWVADFLKPEPSTVSVTLGGTEVLKETSKPWFNPASHAMRVRALLKKYAAVGYPNAQVQTRYAARAGGELALCAGIDEGARQLPFSSAPVVISGLKVSGAKAVSAPRVLAQLKRSGVFIGASLTREALGEALLAIQNLYGDQGFYDAVVTSSGSFTGARLLTLELSVAEGSVFTIGQIAFSESLKAHEPRLRQAMQTKAGARWNRSRWRDDLRRLSTLLQGDGGRSIELLPTMRRDGTKLLIEIGASR